MLKTVMLQVSRIKIGGGVYIRIFSMTRVEYNKLKKIIRASIKGSGQHVYENI